MILSVRLEGRWKTIYKWEVAVLEGKEISRAVISRLPRYFRYLGELKDHGVERISSRELSEQMKVTASQMLNRPVVDSTGEEIGKILGLDQKHNLILVGAGNLGQALANYVNFEKRGFIIQGIFDRNPEIHGKLIRDIAIAPMEEMEAFMRENDVDIAVLTIPKEGAVKMAELLVNYGIKAILNFAHVDLNVPKGVVVENVHLSENLMHLSYNLNRSEQEQKDIRGDSNGRLGREV